MAKPRNLTKAALTIKVPITTLGRYGHIMKKRSPLPTQREKDVLVLVARGLTNHEIADQLGMSSGNIKTLLHQACRKLKARNRIEAVRNAMKQGTISVEDVFSLDELAELLGSLGPDAIELIAEFLRQKFVQKPLPLVNEHILPMEERQDDILTQRERDVLTLVARGLTNKEIADQLYVSISSVRTFLYQACIKLEASTRGQAFISAIKRRAVSVDEAFSLDEMVELLSSLGPEVMDTVARMLRQKLERDQLPLRSE